ASITGRFARRRVRKPTFTSRSNRARPSPGTSTTNFSPAKPTRPGDDVYGPDQPAAAGGRWYGKWYGDHQDHHHLAGPPARGDPETCRGRRLPQHFGFYSTGCKEIAGECGRIPRHGGRGLARNRRARQAEGTRMGTEDAHGAKTPG